MTGKFTWLGLSLALIVVIAAVLYSRRGQVVYTPIVTTVYGQLRGIEANSQTGTRFYKYLGIPFARPPVDKLRYEAPQPPLPWNSVLDADSLGPECVQTDIFFGFRTGEEDCLFLNVYTPPVPPNPSKLLPVLFYIHGGLFITGAAWYLAPDAFMEQRDHEQQVVLVSINYRLGSLGFLNTDDGRIRGNMGLKDQAEALRWVQLNAAAFGGDPKRVTIFGHSAGGVSAHYHLLSPGSSSLFQKAISHSGSALLPWGLRKKPKKQAEWYAGQLGCGSGASIDVDCLKRVPVSEILDVHLKLPAEAPFQNPLMLFAPTVELNDSHPDTFISEHPLQIMNSGRQAAKPWITGFTSHEGLLASAKVITDPSLWEMYDQRWETQPEVEHTFWLEEQTPETKRALRKFYFGSGQKLDPTRLDNFTNLATDLMFAYGVHRAMELQSQRSPTYPFLYTKRSRFSILQFLTVPNKRFPAVVEILLLVGRILVDTWLWPTPGPAGYYEACHGDDSGLWLPNPLMSPQNEDFVFSRELARLWIQFASAPMGESQSLRISDVNWQPWLPKAGPRGHEKYLQLDHEPKSIDVPASLKERFEFLDSINALNKL